MMGREQTIANARRVAADLRRLGANDKAAAVEAALAEFEDGRRASLTITASYKMTLEKFDGEKRPGDGKLPVETVVREGAL